MLERKAVSGILLALLLFSISTITLNVPLALGTDVGGYISTDTTWTLNGSPYIVVGDVIVESGVTLTIEPGVIAKFTSGKNLVIDGNLIAQGNSTHKITFTSNAATPSIGDWGTIRIRNNGTISHSIIEYASQGITFETEGSLMQSLIRSNNIGIYMTTARIVIDSVNVTGNGLGISNTGDQSYPPQFEITLKNSHIQGNDQGIGHSGGRLVVENCTISRNINGLLTNGFPTYTDIYDSEISNNTGRAIWGEGSGTYTTIYSSIISNNVGPGARSWVISILNSVVSNNSYGVMGAVVSISDSIIASNSLDGVSANPHGINIIRSQVSHNGRAGIYLNVGETKEIHYSDIYQNVAYDVKNGGVSDINATYNWWGTTNETLIKEKSIYDYYDNFNLGKVLYKPYLTAPFFEDTIPPSIRRISRTPNIPNYDEDVVVSATITDNVGTDEASLSYTQDSSWHNVSMNRYGNLFNATIPSHPYGTNVQYKIYANDTNGNWAVSELYSYTVEDFLAPEVSLSQTPDYPLPEQKVKVYANVTEPINASGVKNVLFHHRTNNGPWVNTTMVFNGELGLYETTIPDYEKYDVVEYFVKASDNAGNINTTVIHHYEVLRCDANHNGVVDVYDIHMIAKAWESSVGEPEYDFDADIDENGTVDAQDLHLVRLHYGKDA